MSGVGHATTVFIHCIIHNISYNFGSNRLRTFNFLAIPTFSVMQGRMEAFSKLTDEQGCQVYTTVLPDSYFSDFEHFMHDWYRTRILLVIQTFSGSRIIIFFRIPYSRAGNRMKVLPKPSSRYFSWIQRFLRFSAVFPVFLLPYVETVRFLYLS